MNPREARTRLLEQHEHLRARLVEATGLARLYLAGQPVEHLLERHLAELRVVFAAHNRLELSVLEPMLRDTDAWGPARVARMVEEHGAEHAAITRFLDGGLDQVASRLEDFAEDLDAHMAAEERTFLSAAVLRDDIVTDGGPTS